MIVFFLSRRRFEVLPNTFLCIVSSVEILNSKQISCNAIVGVKTRETLPYRKVERQIIVLIKNLVTFFYVPASSFCRHHSKFSCLKITVSSSACYFTWSQLSSPPPPHLSPFPYRCWFLNFSVEMAVRGGGEVCKIPSERHCRDWIRSSRKVRLGPGKERRKSWFGLEK